MMSGGEFQPCSSYRTDIFSEPQYDISVEKYIKDICKPEKSYSPGDETFSIDIESSHERGMLLLSECKWIVDFHLTDDDGVPVKPENAVTVADNFLYTCIDETNLIFDTKEICSTRNNGHAYYNYINTLKKLKFSTNNVMTQLFSFDRPPQTFDKCTIEGNGNQGFNERYEKTKNGEMIRMYGPLGLPFTDTNDRALPSRLKCKLNVKLALPQFCLVSSDAAANKRYKFKLDRICIEAHSIVPRETVYLGIENVLQSKDAIFPFDDTRVYTHAIDNGISSVENLKLAEGQLPVDIHIVLVKESTARGTYSSNPFKFEVRIPIF